MSVGRYSRRKWGTHNPGHLMMELDSADVIQVSVQRKKTTSVLRSNIYRQISALDPARTICVTDPTL